MPEAFELLRERQSVRSESDLVLNDCCDVKYASVDEIETGKSEVAACGSEKKVSRDWEGLELERVREGCSREETGGELERVSPGRGVRRMGLKGKSSASSKGFRV